MLSFHCKIYFKKDQQLSLWVGKKQRRDVICLNDERYCRYKSVTESHKTMLAGLGDDKPRKV